MALDGMAQFWTKDVFTCTESGQPRWCSTCSNWKPDRSHHSKELGRCIRKMDHYCPWMGGMISETCKFQLQKPIPCSYYLAFKFFIQFNVYAALFCIICLGVSSYALHLGLSRGSPVDPWIVLIVALGGFFGIFTFTLAANSMRFVFLNLTTIDVLDYKVITYWLAVRVSRSIKPTSAYKLISLPPPDTSISSAGINTFAIIQTEEGENPWDLGYGKNWKSIMGEHPIDWFLPLRSSPEINYDSSISEYPLGPVYEALRIRHALGTIENHDEKPRRRRRHRTKH